MTSNNIAATVMGLWPALIERRAGLIDAFTGSPRVSFPPVGDATGQAGLLAYFDATHDWLARQRAEWEPLATTVSSGRVVDEGVLVLQRDGQEIRLPVASVADITDVSGEPHISWLRIYHSMWPLRGQHTLRPALLPQQHDLRLSGAPAAYQDALARGDLEGILSTFGPGGCAREPSGGPYRYCGPEGLREFYGSLFANGGGVGLEHCSVTDDGTRCAIEYNAVCLGRTPFPPQAGVGVYERGPDGLLAEARIYDDVDLPLT